MQAIWKLYEYPIIFQTEEAHEEETEKDEGEEGEEGEPFLIVHNLFLLNC